MLLRQRLDGLGNERTNVDNFRKLSIRGKVGSWQRRLRRTLVLLLASFVASSGLAAAAPAAANAAPQLPWSCTQFGTGFTFEGLGLREGTLCATIHRSGLTIKKLEYDWQSLRNTCNWWVDFDVIRPNGSNIFHSQGDMQPDCRDQADGSRLGGLPVQAEAGRPSPTATI